jgi:putative flippase GtrA
MKVAGRNGGRSLVEFVRYGTIGLSSTVLYLAIYGAAVLLGIGFGFASLAGFAASGVYGYRMHDRWTFRTNTPSAAGLTRWLMLQSTVFVVNLAALWLLVRKAGADRLLAQVVLLPLIAGATYLLSRRRVFNAT